MRYYLDTEFNGMGGALISLALVSEDDIDHSIYLYTDCPNPRPWVRQNVMPHLREGRRPTKVKPNGFGPALARFLADDDAPVAVCNWPDDIRHLCQVLKHHADILVDHPRFGFELLWMPCRPENVPAAIAHNAWWDAVALRQSALAR